MVWAQEACEANQPHITAPGSTLAVFGQFGPSEGAFTSKTGSRRRTHAVQARAKRLAGGAVYLFSFWKLVPDALPSLGVGGGSASGLGPGPIKEP